MTEKESELFIRIADHVEHQILDAKEMFNEWEAPEWVRAVYKVMEIQYEMFKLVIALYKEMKERTEGKINENKI